MRYTKPIRELARSPRARRTWWLSLGVICSAFLFPAARVLGQGVGAQGAGEAKANGVVVPAANFQPYVFWAYGLACGLIFLFTLWTHQQSRQVQERVRNLEARLDDTHPET